MFKGVHALIYTKSPEELRTFFRDILGFPSVDAGGGWLIFGLPPAELGIHPDDEDNHCELYLMCDDVHATVKALQAKGVEIVRPVQDQRYGLVTAIRLPGGGELGLYEARHPTALGRTRKKPRRNTRRVRKQKRVKNKSPKTKRRR